MYSALLQNLSQCALCNSIIQLSVEMHFIIIYLSVEMHFVIIYLSVEMHFGLIYLSVEMHFVIIYLNVHFFSSTQCAQCTSIIHLTWHKSLLTSIIQLNIQSTLLLFISVSTVYFLIIYLTVHTSLL